MKPEVLLLDVGYQPLRAITARRALRLMTAEKAEIVETSERTLASASALIPIPSVLRLKYSISIPYRARIPLNRKAVLARDRGTCAYCSKSASTIDHVIPRSRGGKHRWDNVVACCVSCNSFKDSKLLAEINWELPFTPNCPSGIQWMITVPIKETWIPYLGS